MNFPQGPAPPQRKSASSPSLAMLVEHYLAENSNLSYINIDDMVSTLQSKSFRFARMKRPVFANLIRKSYEEYCQRNVQPTQGPTEPAEHDEVDDDSDSDVEIQDYQPKTDIVNSQLTSLYSSPNIAKKSMPITVNTPNASLDTKPKKDDSFVVTEIRELPGTSSVINHASNGKNDMKKPASNSAEDSDPDLEIIEEVKGDGVIRQTNNNAPIANLGENNNKNLPTNGPFGEANFNENSASSREMRNNSINRTDSFPHVVKDEITDTHRMQFLTGNNITITEVSSPDARKLRLMRPIPPIVPLKDETKSTEGESQRIRGTKRKSKQAFDEGLNEDLTRKKLKKEISVVQDSGYRLSDFAGSEKVVEEVCRLLMHLKHPEVYKTLGVTAPRGFLLHGPPGTGKTLLANALAGELQLPMLKVTGTEFISGISGESESNIRDLFNQAVAIAPCIIFIDEIDSITPKRENAQREMERRVVAQLLSCVDDLMNHENGSQVLLIGATNRIEAIDSALRRAGRFDREICLGIPDEKSRSKILSVICRNLRLAPGFDLNLLAKYTPGYVGADLAALVREAAVQAVNKALIGSDKLRNEMDVQHVCDSSCEVSDEVTILTSGTDTAFEKEKESQTKMETSDKQDQPNVTTPSVDEVDLNKDKLPEPEEKIDESVPETMTATEIVPTVEEMEVDSSEVASNTLPAAETVEEEKSIPTVENSNVPLTVSTVDKSVDNLELQPPHPVDVQEEEPLHLRWIRETAPLSKGELDELYIFMDDFEIALKYVQPSSKREGFATVPDTTWDDIGALKDIREELEVSILGPVKHSSAFQMLGLNTPAGVLLCGPPGCGKTLLAKAVANEAGINFISVKGPELLNMYVGESERAVRQCFLRAKNSSPCVIFFDELDALCPRRSDNPESGSGSRIVNQLLTEMDGMESRAGVFVMAATNRPDIIDPAILRPGRLDKILFVDLPTAEDRFEILKAITKEGTRPILDTDVNMKEISEREACDNYTGADLAALVREASIAAFRDLVLRQDGTLSCPDKDLKVSARHFETAFLKTKPSVTKKDRQKYAEMKERYSSIRER